MYWWLLGALLSIKIILSRTKFKAWLDNYFHMKMYSLHILSQKNCKKRHWIYRQIYIYLKALLQPMRHDRLTYWRGTANGLPTHWLFGFSISFNAFGSFSLVNARMHVCCAITIMLFIDLLLVLGYWSAMSMWFNSMKSPGKSEATLNIIVIDPSKTDSHI